MDRFSLEVKVGIVVTVAVALVFAFIFILSDWNPFTNTYRITMTLDYAGGIKPGADVHLAGAKVGKVDAIRFLSEAGTQEQQPVLGLELLIDKRAKDLIRDDSEFTVRMESLLGGKIVEITPGTVDGDLLDDGDTIPGYAPPQLEQLINEAANLIDTLREFLDEMSSEDRERISEFLAALSQIEPEDVDDLRRTLHNAADMSDDLKLIVSDAKPHVKPILTDLEETVSGAGPLVKEARSLIRKIDRISGELRSMAPADTASTREKVEELIAAGEDLAALADRLDRLTAKIEDEFGDLDRKEIERIVREFLQQEGVTINVGTITGKPDYPDPPPK